MNTLVQQGAQVVDPIPQAEVLSPPAASSIHVPAAVAFVYLFECSICLRRQVLGGTFSTRVHRPGRMCHRASASLDILVPTTESAP